MAFPFLIAAGKMAQEKPYMLTGCGHTDGAARARRIMAGLPAGGLLLTDAGSSSPFRISPEPFALPQATISAIARQGRLWLKFQKAAQEIYFRSVRGEAPSYIADYLDAGKPERLIEFGRMNRFRAKFTPIIRPDLLLTDNGLFACELDSVPGGFGLLDSLSRLYAAEGCVPVGGSDGMTSGFIRAMEFVAGREKPAIAIAVSEESRMYLPEMRWMAEKVTEKAVGAGLLRHPTLPPARTASASMESASMPSTGSSSFSTFPICQKRKNFLPRQK